MNPYYQDDYATIYLGDCREILPQLPKVDLVLTDPPYGIGFKCESYIDTEENWRVLMDGAIPLMRRIADMVILLSCQIKRLDWFYRHHKPDDMSNAHYVGRLREKHEGMLI